MADVIVGSSPTGTSGTLYITDDGTVIKFWIKLTNPATFATNTPWNGTVNGVPVNGTFTINGVSEFAFASYTVSTPQTVSVTLQVTGTTGLGGPTTVSATLIRAIVHPKVGGTYRRATPYIKVAGVYKVHKPYVKSAGVYRTTQ